MAAQVQEVHIKYKTAQGRITGVTNSALTMSHLTIAASLLHLLLPLLSHTHCVLTINWLVCHHQIIFSPCCVRLINIRFLLASFFFCKKVILLFDKNLHLKNKFRPEEFTDAMQVLVIATQPTLLQYKPLHVYSLDEVIQFSIQFRRN